MKKTKAKLGTGPGGVGSTDGNSALKLWLKADMDVTAPHSNVMRWRDQSGNRNHAKQSKKSARPDYVPKNTDFNNKPTLRFNGGSHFLVVKHDRSLEMNQAITAFIVIKISNLDIVQGLFAKEKECSKKSSYVLAIQETDNHLIFAHYDSSHHVFVSKETVSTETSIIAMSYDRQAEVGVFGINGQFAGQFIDSINLMHGKYHLTIGVSGLCGDGGDWLQGDLAEVIIYADTLNTAQRIIVENYLSSKYGIQLRQTKQSKQVYVGEKKIYGRYDCDVAGIGRESDGMNTQAYSAGLLVSDRNFLKDNGDYIVFGHNSPTNTEVNDDLPPDVISRWQRVWFVNISDTKKNRGDVILTFDYSACDSGQGINSTYVLLERTNETEPFSIVVMTTTVEDNHVIFVVSTADIIDGRYYTLGKLPHKAIMLVNRAVDQSKQVAKKGFTLISIGFVIGLPIGTALFFLGQIAIGMGISILSLATGIGLGIWGLNRPKALPTTQYKRLTQSHFQLTGNTKRLLAKGDKLTGADVQLELEKIIHAVRSELTRDILIKVENIQISILKVLPYIADVNSSDHTIYAIRHTALQYLPETLENYLKLPKDFANNQPIKGNKTARQLLLEQLDLLDHKMKTVAQDFHRNDAHQLLAHGKFLEEKFGMSDMWSDDE
ncbi:MAG: hypothetical protein B6242_13555 [Anaerolineaceae bacterium 4572_78]|nr:MAG: hypothetical protein B6242_13555 [Anaerolineaceae bacterium 4572_78]